MNRSFSKIRHIQEANALLEKRVISEQDTVAAGAPVTSSAQAPSVQPQDPNAIEPTQPQDAQLPFCSAKLKDVVVPGQKMVPGASRQLQLPQGTVTVTYNGTGSPENRGFKVNVDGKPFCFIAG